MRCALPLLLVTSLGVACFQAPTFVSTDVIADEIGVADGDAAVDADALPCVVDGDCTNNDLCDGVERCVAGTCEPGTPVVCIEPTEPCKAAACVPASGACQVVDLANETPCDDGLSCTNNSSCDSGTCQAGTIAAETCLINGACAAAGQPSSDGPCAACIPGTSQNVWTSTALLNEGMGYLTDTTAALNVTDTCHQVAFGCDNCVDPSNPTVSLNLAANAGVNIFSVPVVWRDGEVRVGEPATEAPFTLAAVVEAALVSQDRLVAVRITDAVTPGFVSALVAAVGAAGLARPNRPLIVRGPLPLVDAISEVRDGFEAVPSLAPHIRYHFMADTAAGYADFVTEVNALAQYLHAVEFDMVAHPLAMAKLRYAKSLGLGVGARLAVTGIERAVLMTAVRDVVDFVMVTAPGLGDVKRLTSSTSLLHVDLSRQEAQDSDAFGCIFESALQTIEATDKDQAGLVTTSPFDGTLVLDFTGPNAITLFDADNTVGEGHIVTALVELTDVAPSTDAEELYQGIITKAEGSSFALEIQYKFLPATLQFASRTFDSYAIASQPLAAVPLNQPVWLVGAYSGDGLTYLWLDGVLITSAAEIQGGITFNDSPVTLGGDPPGGIDPPAYMTGYLHAASLFKWGPAE